MKHLLTMDQLSATEITAILDTAASLRRVTDRPIKKLPTLRDERFAISSTSRRPVRGSRSSSLPSASRQMSSISLPMPVPR